MRETRLFAAQFVVRVEDRLATVTLAHTTADQQGLTGLDTRDPATPDSDEIDHLGAV